MITSDVITRVRRSFGDDAAVQIQDADVIRWINDGQIEVVRHNEGALQKIGFIDLVASQQSYTLPADLLLLRSLRFKTLATDLSYVKLEYKSMQQFDESIDGWDGTQFGTDTSVFFTMFENKALLWPIPDTSLVSGLKVLYNQRPTDVVLTTDPLSLPLIYHNTIVKYCLWQASNLDDDHDPAMMYKNDFTEDVNRMLTREAADATSTYPTITVREFDQ